MTSKCLLAASAVVVEAGSDKEDRLRKGSYIELRNQEQTAREAAQRELRKHGSAGGYLPDFLQPSTD